MHRTVRTCALSATAFLLIGLAGVGRTALRGAAPAAPVGKAPPAVPWEQVLGAAQGTIPMPRAGLDKGIEIPTLRQVNATTRINWDTDLPAGLKQAKSENRPIFLTFRCLPCRTCSDFDKDVLEGGPDLDPLLRQFVTVRLTGAKDVDLRLLPLERFQDLDVSWWGWFLSPQGQVYGIFGGRDQVSDTTRTSKAALIATLKRVLAHHYDPRRAGWDIDGPVPDLSGKAPTPADLPGYASWVSFGKRKEEVAKNKCLHCHQVAEVMRQPAIDAKTFDKHRDLEIWPLPENIGVVVGRDHGLLVKSVRPDSPAAKAGLQPGDEIGAAATRDGDPRGRRLFSQADLRGVLHRGPRDAGTIDLWYLRDRKVTHAALQLADGWRKTSLEWRASVAEANIGPTPGFWPNPGDKHRKRLGIAEDRMAVQPHLGFQKPSGVAYDAGLRPDDIIVAVNGKSPNLVHRAWLVWFRMNHEPGEEITLTVQDAPDKTREIRYRPR